MKTLSAIALLLALTGAAFAQTSTPASPGASPGADTKPSCKAQASDKKLAGAALTSFMKKCETDAQKACDAAATDKKLSGAAKTSFTKKCVTDSVGSST
jgi:hypothetical protein